MGYPFPIGIVKATRSMLKVMPKISINGSAAAILLGIIRFFTVLSLFRGINNRQGGMLF